MRVALPVPCMWSTLGHAPLHSPGPSPTRCPLDTCMLSCGCGSMHVQRSCAPRVSLVRFGVLPLASRCCARLVSHKRAPAGGALGVVQPAMSASTRPSKRRSRGRSCRPQMWCAAHVRVPATHGCSISGGQTRRKLQRSWVHGNPLLPPPPRQHAPTPCTLRLPVPGCLGARLTCSDVLASAPAAAIVQVSPCAHR